MVEGRNSYLPSSLPANRTQGLACASIHSSNYIPSYISYLIRKIWPVPTFLQLPSIETGRLDSGILLKQRTLYLICGPLT